MNSSGRGNWFLMFVVAVFVIGFGIFVMAATGPDLVGSDVAYATVEGGTYSHNFSANITGFANDVNFSIDTEEQIYWTNENGRNGVSASTISSWLRFYNANTGNLTINASYDNQTGLFEIPIQATNTSSGYSTVIPFNFTINATNDAPNITNVVDNQEFNWSSSASSNFTIAALDEEMHYPLNFSLSVVNCTHGALTGRNPNENCSIFDFTNISNNSATLNLSYSTDLVGTYWFRMNVSESDHACPHAYCDPSYTTNLNESHLVKLSVLSTLEIDATDCTGSWVEGGWLNCTINITTLGESQGVNASSYAFFYSGTTYGGNIENRRWFYDNQTLLSENYLNITSVSILLNKSHVGNWTINFTADDGSGTLVTGQTNISVNWTESNVSMDKTYDGEAFLLYQNQSLSINATDDDLLIPDKNIKREYLTFASNVSWVKIIQPNNVLADNSNLDYMAPVSTIINYDERPEEDCIENNCSVLINVTNIVGNTDNITIMVMFSNDTAPEWNLSKTYENASYEGDNIYLNLSDGWASDSDEEDTLIFYYSNATPFDNFNLTSAGIIDFTSTDADVGFHNMTIIAGDSKLNSTFYFNFTIYNVVDAPVISYVDPEGTVTVAEGDLGWINITITDDDYLIPNEQASLYNESISVNAGIDNLTIVTTLISFDFLLADLQEGTNTAYFTANFTPDGIHVGEYNITINVTDAWGDSAVSYVTLNITDENDAPVLEVISNYTKTVNDDFYLDVNATDEEESEITYALYNLTVGGNFLTINSTSGEINITLNETYAGFWEYNVTANDTLDAVGSEVFSLTVYGTPNITAPLSNYIFNWSEGNSTGGVYFNVSYAVNNTVLSYKFYMDKIAYYNSTHFNYTNLSASSSIINQTNFTLLSSNNFSLNYTPNYTDETYGFLKNLTLVVYNPAYPELNDTVNWKVNVTHTNQNVSFITGAHIGDKGPVSVGSLISINLSQYFEDADYWDQNISQTVNFTIETVSGTTYVQSGSSFSGWTLTLNSLVATTEVIRVRAYEWNSSNVTIDNASSNQFQVEFIEPTTTTVTTPSSGGGGGSTKIKHYSLKLIVPQDVIISEKNYIDIPFTVQNDGQLDLSGINLNSFVRFNDEFSDDVKISLGENYIPELKFGQAENFTMRINANTQRSGRYKATILANVTSPKFSDWGDFFIELKRTNESEAEQILIFTEKLIAENPECLELTELLNEANEAFSLGEYSNSLRLAQEVTDACEDAIEANEQIRYPVAGFVKENFYYISFTTLVIFFVGFVFYVYKRARFNKSKMDDYI